MVCYDLPKTINDAMTTLLVLAHHIYISFHRIHHLWDNHALEVKQELPEPVLVNHYKYYLSEQSTTEYGQNDRTFRAALQKAVPVCFNCSKHFVRNGTTLNQCSMMTMMMKM
jgi:hypothetical protein